MNNQPSIKIINIIYNCLSKLQKQGFSSMILDDYKKKVTEYTLYMYPVYQGSNNSKLRQPI